MKVKELKERLEDFDDDSEVVFMDYEPVVSLEESWDNEDPEKSYCFILDR